MSSPLRRSEPSRKGRRLKWTLAVGGVVVHRKHGHVVLYLTKEDEEEPTTVRYGLAYESP